MTAHDHSYSKAEADAKLETIEQRIDNSLDRLSYEMREGFKLINKDINWLKAVTMTILGLLLSILVAAAIKSLVHI